MSNKPITMLELANEIASLESGAANVTVTASKEGAWSPTGSLRMGEVQGTIYTLSRIAGITAGTRTLQGLLQELVDRSHSHGSSATTFNCFCNCNCSD